MTWNTKPDTSQVLEAVERRSATFTLAGQPLGKAEEVEYLAVSMNASGVTESKILDRIRKDKIAVYQLRALGVSTKGINIRMSIMMYKCLVQPR